MWKWKSNLRALVLAAILGLFVCGAAVSVRAQEDSGDPGGAAAEVGGDVAAPIDDTVGAADVGDTGVEDAEAEGEAEENGALNYSFIQLIQFGGVVGYVIIFLSVVAVGLVIDDLLLLRQKVLLPAAEVEEIRTLVQSGRGAEIANGEPRSSFIGAMAVAGLRELDRGYEAVVKGMEDAADEVTGRLLRRIEYLNVIANVSPMLGLLGTVMGMVQCFNQISVAAGGADPRLLAAGIFQALMTTVMGLIVAIPAFFAFSLFRNRVDALAAAAATSAEDVLAPLRPRAKQAA